MKGNDDYDKENEIMPMAPAIESLCRRHSAMTSKAAQKPAPKLDSKPNQSFVGKSLLKALRKQAARSQATKERVSGNTGKAVPIFFDET